MSDSASAHPDSSAKFACPQCHAPVRTGGITCHHSGVSLALAAVLAERISGAHDSKIEVESTLGQGSLFAFELPTTSPGEPA
jgi:hypothetical protein